ncbi:MAG: hypothetical protein AAGI52_00520 [Bacteroidota bacterium]
MKLKASVQNDLSFKLNAGIRSLSVLLVLASVMLTISLVVEPNDTTLNLLTFNLAQICLMVTSILFIFASHYFMELDAFERKRLPGYIRPRRYESHVNFSVNSVRKDIAYIYFGLRKYDLFKSKIKINKKVKTKYFLEKLRDELTRFSRDIEEIKDMINKKISGHDS